MKAHNFNAADVWRYYKTHGRHDLPWRKTRDPYKILVSEVMLQQTQVSRVIPKYTLFLKTFPTPRALAGASLHDVLSAWQGLGYNRRAKALKRAAEVIVAEHTGVVPNTPTALEALPGVGRYTASAVLAFAFNKPVACIETNIRTVYLHYFFQDRETVRDAEVITLIEATMDKKNPREWLWALMDYGTYLKQTGIKLNAKHAGYKKQSAFKGSDREIRGAVVRILTQEKEKRHTIAMFAKKINASRERILPQLEQLQKEGLIRKDGRYWALTD